MASKLAYEEHWLEHGLKIGIYEDWLEYGFNLADLMACDVLTFVAVEMGMKITRLFRWLLNVLDV